MPWICRNYVHGDERQILDLFNKVFQREMSPEFWNWRFVENPFGRGIIKLAFDRDKLVGHYAVIPIDVQVQGRITRAVFSMTTMTDPDYSGQGIFTHLAEETYKDSQRSGFRFVYGFPNRNSCYGFEHKLNWQGLSRMNALEKTLPDKAAWDYTGEKIIYIEHFDRRFNSLWEKIKQSFNVIVPRTMNYLNWRFVKNPEVDYVKYIVYDSSTVAGYSILKVYKTEDTVKGHIVDLLSINDVKVLRVLLDNAYDYFQQKEIQEISCWMPQNSLYYGFLLEEGFTVKETETYFGCRKFEDDEIPCKGIESFGNWHLTMADSDVY